MQTFYYKFYSLNSISILPFEVVTSRILFPAFILSGKEFFPFDVLMVISKSVIFPKIFPFTDPFDVLQTKPVPTFKSLKEIAPFDVNALIFPEKDVFSRDILPLEVVISIFFPFKSSVSIRAFEV